MFGIRTSITGMKKTRQNAIIHIQLAFNTEYKALSKQLALYRHLESHGLYARCEGHSLTWATLTLVSGCVIGCTVWVLQVNRPT